MNKEFVPEGKTVNAEFNKGVMDRLLKRIQRVRPAAFCFIAHRTLQIYLRQTVFFNPS
jgi:hypothetical protein